MTNADTDISLKYVQKKVCKLKEYTFRHPKLCRNGENCKFLKINGCQYKHVINDYLEQCKTVATEMKMKKYEEEIEQLRIEINGLKDLLESKEAVIIIIIIIIIII